MDEFIAAAREVLNLQNQQIAAVIRGQEGFGGFEKPLQDARKKKDDAMRAYARHLEKHGC